jgi:hypothetical protein
MESLESPTQPVRRLLPWLGVALLYTAVTCAYFWPLPRLWRDHLGPDWGDPLYVLYVLKWGARQIQLGLPDFWNANFFHPTRDVLAFSEHLLGPAAFVALLQTVVPSAVAGYNALFLSSFVGCALAVCWVLRRSGLSWIGGGMYAFSPYRLSQLSHLQMLLAQWIPLTLWFWDRLLARRTVKDAAFFLLFYLLNLAGCCYIAYMTHFCLLAIFLSRLAVERKDLFSRRSLRLLVPVILVAAVAGVAIFLPYVRVARAQGYARTPGEIEAYGARPLSYLSPSVNNAYFGDEANRILRKAVGPSAALFYRSENSLFAGFLPTALFFVGAVTAFAGFRNRRNEPADPWARGVALSGLICVALSFSWVYVPLAKVIPGLSGMRVPTRFYVLVSFAVVFFAARGLDVLRRRMPGPKARLALAGALAVILLAELAPRRLQWARLPRVGELPRAYAWIRDEPSVKALVELPLFRNYREVRYLYNSTAHWKPIANGYSGYSAASYNRLANRIRFLPNVRGFDLLREMGISHIVVHTHGPGRERALRSWEDKFLTGGGRQIERVYREEGISIYRVL